MNCKYIFSSTPKSFWKRKVAIFEFFNFGVKWKKGVPMGPLIYFDIYLYIFPEGRRSLELYVIPYTLFFAYTRHMDTNARGIIYSIRRRYGGTPNAVHKYGAPHNGIPTYYNLKTIKTNTILYWRQSQTRMHGIVF